jgi:hypothetical protein
MDRIKQHISASRWMSLTAVLLLLISVSMTVRMLQLQQELRQRAAPNACKTLHAECNINQSDKSCCSGLTCAVNNPKSGNGKCVLQPPPVQPTTPPIYNPPPNPTAGPEGSGTTETAPIGGSGPDPVVCGPNGCGWSPRPEGEKSTTEAPGVQVCTTSFNGPKQLVGTRLSPTSIRFNWWPTPGGADKQFIQYGLESGKAQWGLINIAGNQGQIVIDHLPANRTIWAQVRAYRGNCYEDTGWVSTGASFQAKQIATVLQPTSIPSPTITVQPTKIAIDPAFYFASPAPAKPHVTRPFLILATWNIPGLLTLIAILLTVAFILRKHLFILFLKKKRKKKE